MELLTDNDMEFNEEIKMREIRPEERQILKEFYEGDIFPFLFDTHNSKIEDHERVTDSYQKEIEEPGSNNFINVELSLENIDEFSYFDQKSLFRNKIDCQIQSIQSRTSKEDEDNANESLKIDSLAERFIQIRKSRKRRKITSKFGRFKCNVNPETKNISKNYGKQIISFLKNEKKLTKKVLKKIGSHFTPESLNQNLKKEKKSLNKIEDLRKLWIERPFCREFRIMTQLFLRKYYLQWIFNSRLENLKNPIKYRYRILEGVKNPSQFFYLKDF